jgi:hypothetical protein
VAGGVACVAAGLWLMTKLPRLRELVRPIYIERGILATTEAEAAKAAGLP